MKNEKDEIIQLNTINLISKSNQNLRIIIKIIAFQEMIYQRVNLEKKRNENLKSINDGILVLRKNVMRVLKDFLDYEEIIQIIKKNNFEILNPIKDKNNIINYDELNDIILEKIIDKLPEKLVYPKEKKNIKELFDKMKEENKKELKYYKCIKFGKPKPIKLVFLDDLEMINIDIYNDIYINLINKEDLELVSLFLFSNIIIENKYIFILIKEMGNLGYEIGKYNENKIFKIEYILNKNQIDSSTFFLDFLQKNGINYIVNNFKNNKDLNSFEYQIELPKKQKIIIDCYKVDQKKIIIKPTNDTKNLKQYYNERIKILILLLSYHIKYFPKELKCEKNTKIDIQDAFFMNRKFIEFFYFNDLQNMIYINEKIKNDINNMNIKDLTLDYAGEIINKLSNESLKNINKAISQNKNDIPFNAKQEEIELINNKKIIFYNDFVLIDRKIFSYLFEKYFFISLKNQCMSFISNNNEDILIIHNESQNTIFVGKYDNDKYFYKIDYILYFENFKKLDNELKSIKSLGFNSYINKKLILSKINENETYVFPIFTENEIVGYLYKYNLSILNYNNIINYIEYLKNLNLKLIISLYIYYKIINNKLLSKQYNIFNYEKYYLINHNLLENIKKDVDYNIFNEYLDKHYANLNNIEKINKENILSLISILSPELLNKYSKKEINKDIYKNNNIEPNEISFNYTDHEMKNMNIIIYNNFELIDKTLGEILFQNIQLKTFAECIFINGYIIVNLPNNKLNNNKFISLIGIIDYENNFLIKYIFIYIKDLRKKHLSSIWKKFDEYINNLNFQGSNPPITYGNNYEIIGTIIKYDINLNQKLSKIENNNINDFNLKNSNNEKNSNNNYINTFNNDNMNNNNVIDSKNNNKGKNLNDNFEICPKIGLQNIGATCYMNATLQCFCHIKEFVEYFKYKIQNNILENKKNLSSSFKILVDNLWPDKKSKNNYYSPVDFKDKISSMNPLFKGIAANDSKDLVNFIILTLHLELNETKKKINNENMKIDQTKKECVFQAFCEYFLQNNNSIISTLFYATNCNVTECYTCHTPLFNYQTYFFIVFPLEEVRKFVNQNNQFNYNNNVVDIYQCFEYDRKINVMAGDNSLYCNYCKLNSSCGMYTYLVTGPNILILILNRGKGKQFDVKINFYEYLNLNNYIEYKNTGFNYQLIGVITHIGESSMSGHFIAYCRDPLIKKWSKYNDALVSDVNNFQNEVINFAMPYLLFYQKIDS